MIDWLAPALRIAADWAVVKLIIVFFRASQTLFFHAERLAPTFLSAMYPPCSARASY
jgi:hypothetical protein